MHFFQYGLNVGHGNTNRFWGFVAVGFVFGKHFGASDRPPFVETHGQIVGALAFDHVQQGIHEAKNGGGVYAFGIDAWIFDERKVAAKNQGIGVEKKKAFVVGHGQNVLQLKIHKPLKASRARRTKNCSTFAAWLTRY